MIRRLLLAVVIVVVGYVIGRADAAYGHAPWLLLCGTAVLSWLAGASWATLNRERDDACAIALSVHEGAALDALPSYIDKAEADRLNRRFR